MDKEGFLPSTHRKRMNILDGIQKDRISQRATGQKNSFSSLFKEDLMDFVHRLPIAFHISSGSSRAKGGLK
ncbi:MAG: hypothetical protein PVI11_08895 [Candidatus Aminicenantes bacterium]|jgi:hypothetical protein